MIDVRADADDFFNAIHRIRVILGDCYWKPGDEEADPCAVRIVTLLHAILADGGNRAPALDAERMADALWNAFSSVAHAEHESDDCGDTCRWYRALALGDSERLIREYRALGDETKDDGA